MAAIEIDHTSRRGWFRAGSDVEVRISHAVADQETVSCVIAGHDRLGTEVVADTLRADVEPLSWEVSGRCGFETRFAYAWDEGPSEDRRRS